MLLVWPLAEEREAAPHTTSFASVSALRILMAENGHAGVSGNKVHKLRFHLQAAQERNARHVVSFGGAWSNHLHALAHACRDTGLPFTAFVRGSRPTTLSPTLQDLQALGVQLEFIPWSDWAGRHARVAGLGMSSDAIYVVPDGGGGEPGLRGCRDWGEQLARLQADLYVVALGTGVTAAGLRWGLDAAGAHDALLWAVPAYNAWQGFAPEIDRLAQQHGIRLDAITIRQLAQAGRFGHPSPSLQAFQRRWQAAGGVELDRVYTLRCAWFLEQQRVSGALRDFARVVLIHTGGLQGNRRLSQPGAAG